MNYFYDFEFLEGTQDKTFMGIKYGKTLPTIQPISIGMVSEDGREYYAIFNDFNLKEAWNRFDLNYGSGDQRNRPPRKVYWIRENVLFPIYYELCFKENPISIMEYNNYNSFVGAIKSSNNYKYVYKNLKRLIVKYGKPTKQVAQEIKDFCMPKQKRALDAGIDAIIGNIDEPVNLYGYYSAYDHVALSWCFGKMIDLPNGFPMLTLDLKQMLDEALMKEYPINGGSVTLLHSTLEAMYVIEIRAIKTLQEKLQFIKKHCHTYPAKINEHSAIHDARFNKKLYSFIKTI